MKFKLPLIAVVAIACYIQACKKSSAPVHTPVDYQLILRPDASTGQDSYVSKRDNDPSDGNTNLNFANELVLARVTQSGGDSFTCHGYLRFDSLVKVPAKATVTSAMLYLYGEGTDSSASIPYGDSYPNAYNLSNDGWLQMVTGGTWDQKTITFNNAPAATT